MKKNHVQFSSEKLCHWSITSPLSCTVKRRSSGLLMKSTIVIHRNVKYLINRCKGNSLDHRYSMVLIYTVLMDSCFNIFKLGFTESKDSMLIDKLFGSCLFISYCWFDVEILYRTLWEEYDHQNKKIIELFYRQISEFLKLKACDRRSCFVAKKTEIKWFPWT